MSQKPLAPNSVATEILVAFTNNGIRHCLWKSIDRWADSETGKTDIDLLLSEGDRDLAFECLAKKGWITLYAEAWRRFPCVYDFVSYDPVAENWIHLHLHTRIVTGEKMTKSFSPPWTEYYLDHSVSEPWPSHVIPEIEFVMFILRLSIKLTWIDYARIVRRRSFRMIYRDWRGEYDYLRGRCSREQLVLTISDFAMNEVTGRIVLDTFDDLYSLKLLRRMQLSHFIAPYRRMGFVERNFKTLWRSWQRRTNGVGKLLPGKGISVAVLGADGSGKTTTVDLLRESLGNHFRVDRVYMGGNLQKPGKLRGLVMYGLMPAYLVVRKIFKITGLRIAVRFMERIYYGLDDWLMCLEKERRYRRAQTWINLGHLVLFERFPIFSGYGDGMPVTGNFIPKKVMERFYGNIEEPDLIFVMCVSADVAKSRRPKDPSSEVDGKVAAFEKFLAERHASSHVHKLDGTQPLSENLKKISLHINALAIGRSYDGKHLLGTG